MFAECLATVTHSYGLPVSLFLAGLAGGFAHCSGMCGPFVLAQTGGKVSLSRLPASLLLPYHLGRMTTYITLAIVFGGLLNIAYVFAPVREIIAIPMLILAAVFFLVSALPFFRSVFPWAAHMNLTPRMVQKLIASATRMMSNDHPVSRYALGVLLGFMPCGMVLAALLACATAGSVFESAFAMAAFALGTMPALMLIGLGGAALKERVPLLSRNLQRTALVLSGVWLLIISGGLIF